MQVNASSSVELMVAAQYNIYYQALESNHGELFSIFQVHNQEFLLVQGHWEMIQKHSHTLGPSCGKIS